ncbi:MAG: acyl-CoA/acyl-ACP dehydrogenase [Kofleriaceae bacterium]|jgi:(2S)-methylsuccinyl-CoA dehydrogenase|nr:acyl-CoA/acyl-ACP dehydrogenase [Kofleriaceae bacterium]MBP9172546.1 acyl-CoA/acyl-ACP dehydrogenase [Kofleriaceae bacterium]MBP9861546.1 acyl-CoA/acyl-ACP dehydrogenase [Kofleriaceae bacterium]
MTTTRDDDARLVVQAVAAYTEAALAAAGRQTGGGERIDDHQVVVERVASAATDARVARSLAAALDAHPGADDSFRAPATAALADLARSARERLEPVADALGLPEVAYDGATRAAIARLGAEEVVRAIGREVAAARGKNPWPLEPTLSEVRQSVRQFADRVIAPGAEHLHRHDELVADSVIAQMAELGYFGLSVPEAFGGHELGNLAMVLTTEELSRASLAGAGSLITRPEILAKALLAGGTEAQKATWLPKLAAGERMVAISVTEPNVGSDVAAVACRAIAATVDGVAGYRIDGAKAWCTFAGRADVIAVLARTDPDPTKGAKGLSLFIVEKPRFDGHEFVATQPSGGRLTGKADRTPGYRGMHSFTLAFDDWFVPATHLVGEAAGLGRGFYLQMAGFAAGRLQTGGRACGLAQAAVERTAEYVVARGQFGRPIIEYGLTQHQLGRMACRLAAARAITYEAAVAMDGDERAAAPLAAQAKLFACDAAVEITQLGQVLHGGWGYAEEYPISRYVVDALVLPIFEGVRPILALKVVGRALLAGRG